MSNHIYKKIELVGSSPDSIEDAVKNALAKASGACVIFAGSRLSKLAATSKMERLGTGRSRSRWASRSTARRFFDQSASSVEIEDWC